MRMHICVGNRAEAISPTRLAMRTRGYPPYETCYQVNEDVDAHVRAHDGCGYSAVTSASEKPATRL
jgi:hypothetical protein